MGCIRPRVLMYTLLLGCVAAGVIVAVVGVYGGRSSRHGSGDDIKGPYLKLSPPSSEEQRKSFGRDVCFDSLNITWKSGKDGFIYANNEVFMVKGISWSGPEGTGMTFTGLGRTSIDTVLDWVTEKRYNTVRLPVSVAFAFSDDKTDPPHDYVSRELRGKSIWEIYDIVLDKMASRGLMAVIDMHDLEPLGNGPLWYDDAYSEDDIMRAWGNLMKHYGRRWNVMALDIKNEPWGNATWGDDRPKTDVNRFYERAITYIGDHFPEYKGLFLVEGIQFMDPANHGAEQYPSWWGGNFQNAKALPIDVKGLNDRIVYSPHVYGPSVYEHDYFKGEDYLEKLPVVWEYQLGWLASTLQSGILVGEWGGSLEGKDKHVQEHLAKWMADHCLVNNIWWGLDSSSKDVGGIIQADWKSYNPVKVQVVSDVMPDPSAFAVFDSKLCMHRGTLPQGCRAAMMGQQQQQDQQHAAQPALTAHGATADGQKLRGSQ